MFQSILELDKSLLLFFNSHHLPWCDGFVYLFSSSIIWLPLYAVMLYVIFKREELTNSIFVFSAIFITILLSDQISSGLMKPFFERLRPSHQPGLQELLHYVNNYRGGQFGFASSHAANSFALAMFTSLLFKSRYFTVAIFSWATFNAFTRLYLGVHYPTDVLVGAVIGVLVAWGIFVLMQKAFIFRAMKVEQTYRSQYIIVAILFQIVVLMLAAKIFIQFFK